MLYVECIGRHRHSEGIPGGSEVRQGEDRRNAVKNEPDDHYRKWAAISDFDPMINIAVREIVLRYFS